jgi:hypothetical protein
MKYLTSIAALSLVFACPLLLAEKSPRTERLRLILPACSSLPFDQKQLVELLKIELQDIGIDGVEAVTLAAPLPAEQRPSIAIVVEACDPAAPDVELALVRDGAIAAERTMPIADVPTELRSRAIAIGIVELLQSTWPVAPVPASTPPADSGAVPTASSAAAIAPAATPANNFEFDRGPVDEPKALDRSGSAIEAAVGAWIFPKPETALLGPSAVFALGFDRRLRASVGANAAFGQAEPAAGAIDMGWLSGHLGLGLTGRGRFRAVVEPRLYLGFAWASGNPRDEQRVTGSSAGRFISAVALSGGVRGELSDSWDIAADLELGHVLNGAVFLVDQDRAAGLSGILLGSRLGVTLWP